MCSVHNANCVTCSVHVRAALLIFLDYLRIDIDIIHVRSADMIKSNLFVIMIEWCASCRAMKKYYHGNSTPKDYCLIPIKWFDDWRMNVRTSRPLITQRPIKSYYIGGFIDALSFILRLFFHQLRLTRTQGVRWEKVTLARLQMMHIVLAARCSSVHIYGIHRTFAAQKVQ